MKRLFFICASVLIALTFLVPVPSKVYADGDSAENKRKELVEQVNRWYKYAEDSLADYVKSLEKDYGRIVCVGIQFIPQESNPLTLFIVNVMKKSPAEASGLVKGDTVLAVNGKTFTKSEDYVKEIKGDGAPGRVVTLRVRKGNLQDVFSSEGSQEVTIVFRTAVVREDVTKEALELRDRVLQDGQFRLKELRRAADAIVKSSGSIAEDQAAAQLNSFFREENSFYAWLNQKDEEEQKLFYGN